MKRYLTKVQAAILGVVLLIGVSCLAGSLLAKTSGSSPADSSAEAGFARDMSVHHNQAVEMSFIIRDSSVDKDIRLFAFDVINTQSVQIGMMSGWLQEWGLPQTSIQPALEWTGETAQHDSSGANHQSSAAAQSMPGMATPEDIDRLRGLSGAAAELLYLNLMIKHHQGGISMAESALRLAKNTNVRNLAQSILNGQQAEIEYMQSLLKIKQT